MEYDFVDQILPKGPIGLSFEKEIFMKDDFNVDTFVVKHRKSVNLETLHDDLQLYLKILQSAMIELINKDYADFVNLSTNLVGMDKAIKNITVPLGQLKEEVLSVKLSMSTAISAMEHKLRQRQELREKREALQRLVNIQQSVEKIERLVRVQHADVGDGSATVGELNGRLIERVATEFNKLQFYVAKSRGHILVESVKHRITDITSTLQNSLEGAFLRGLEGGDREILRQCLRTYALIDRTREAEKLFSQHVVLPRIKQMITEQAIKAGSDGLKTTFAQVLEFVPRHCEILNDVTSAKDHRDEIQGYDFVVNSVWPVVVNVIDTQAPSIFAPGNPSVFHQRYRESMSFLSNFELLCGSRRSVQRLRSHPAYNLFMSKWSLPVYFQIRFQEIAGSLEKALLSTQAYHQAPADSGCELRVSHAVWACLRECWADHIYLAPLAHRFLKLTFQIISRFIVWLKDMFQVVSGGKGTADTSTEATDNDSSDNSKGDNTTRQLISMGQIVSLICDVQTIADKLQVLCDEHVIPTITHTGFNKMDAIKESFAESRTALLSQLPQYHHHVVSDIVSQCGTFAKQVNDAPRLYRRTNREAPTKASPYIARMMQPITQHLGQHCGVMTEGNRKLFICDVITTLTQQYASMTGDVLTSVKKMEESLKRLKKARGGQTSGGAAVSDDDKIRRQIMLDVEEFVAWIDKFAIRSEAASSIDLLMEQSAAAKSSMA